MRRSTPFVMLLALLAAPGLSHAVASVPFGCNLSWNQCYGDGQLSNKGFACNSNSDADVLVASFMSATELNALASVAAVIDLASTGPALPAWWQFINVGSCRAGALGIDLTLPTSAVVCEDWQAGQGAGAIASYVIGLKGPNTARLIASATVPFGSLGAVHALREYFAFSLRIGHEKTTGTASCGGRQTPVCLIVNEIQLTTPVPANDVVLIGPSDFTSSHIALWQGGPVTGHPPFYGCPAIVPAKQQTWSAVKSLYR